jgi:cytochrome c553
MKSFAKFLLAAALLSAIANVSFAADATPAKPDPAKGETRFNTAPPNGVSCASCHNADGNSAITANPKLAQQHPEYLLKQLEDFKSGKRKSAVMQPMVQPLSAEEMRNIAWFLGAQTMKPGFSKDKDLVTLGERIFRGGVADRQIPACAGCHSPNGAGIPSQYPRLAGQHADYVETQLKLFRGDGSVTRLNSAPMTGVAARMNDTEIKAVSDYIAGLR